MDTRFRYGLGVLILGFGNVAYGIAEFTSGSQSMLFVALEVIIGILLAGFGIAILDEPDRIDPEKISPLQQKIVGWGGILLGIGLFVGAALLLVTTT